jgi:hypothetical protein
VLSELAAQEGRSVADLLEYLAEQARRERILTQSAARMAEIMDDPEERRAYLDELRLSEAVAGATLESEPPYADERCRA